MVLTLPQRPETRSLNRTAVRFHPDDTEFVAFCPGCKTMETVWFNDGRLMQTRKFSQRGGEVFHDCGTTQPCRLLRPR